MGAIDRRVLAAQTWCRERGLPYLHGCLWDRHCRSHYAPLRITLFVAHHSLWLDLPGYYRDVDWRASQDRDDGHVVVRRFWHRPSVGHYANHRRRKDPHA